MFQMKTAGKMYKFVSSTSISELKLSSISFYQPFSALLFLIFRQKAPIFLLFLLDIEGGHRRSSSPGPGERESGGGDRDRGPYKYNNHR